MSAAALPPKQKWPAAVGLEVARELCAALQPLCHRLVVAGSLRRRRELVGDVEIVYIGKTEVCAVPGDMFERRKTNLADAMLLELETRGVLARRLNSLGSESYGPKNKFVRHLASGMPVDLFTATEENWWNYLVCRTGPAASNVLIASRAEARGWKWKTYGAGFYRDGQIVPMRSEAEVFEAVGLPYREPWERT